MIQMLVCLILSQGLRDYPQFFSFFLFYSAIQKFSSVLSCVQLFVTPCMPGLPVHHQLLEFTQTHIHWVSDAIQPSHPLSSLSPPALNHSHHQGLFQWVNSLHEVAKVFLPMNIQDWSPVGWTGWISSQSKGLPRVFSNTTVQKHQFFSAQLSLQPNSHIQTWLLKIHSLD